MKRLRTGKTARRPLSRGRRALFVATYFVYLGVLVALAAWGYWWFRTGGSEPGVSPIEQVWRIQYRELIDEGLEAGRALPGDDTPDVLLLGGSVLEQTGGALRAALEARLGRSVRLYNIAHSAHTSRDSLLKYRHLEGKDFDLVIFYHGINDVRMNCVPAEDYRDDYTHCRWYEQFERRLKAGRLLLSEFLREDLQAISGAIPLGEPEPEMLQYGSVIKTERAFAANLGEIARLAAERRQPLLVMTFAYYLPANYTKAAFVAGELDYGQGVHQLPAEVWGLPQNVARTVDVHNAVVRRLAEEKGLTLVDQQALLPTNGRVFSDPCHLTPQGIVEFANNVAPAAVKLLKQGSHKSVE